MNIFIVCVHSNPLALKDFIPILIAISVFILNVIYQEFNKRNNIRDKISSEVISTCDKMIRYSIETEYSTLAWKYWTKKWQMLSVKEGDEIKKKLSDTDIKNALSECLYYHRKLEDTGLKLDLLKSELKKFTKDLQKYWHNELETRQIISLMSKAVIKDSRRFEDELIKKYNSEAELSTDYNALLDNVVKEVIFENIGYDLVRIQKIIDPKSPTLILSNDLEKELLEKIKRDNN